MLHTGLELLMIPEKVCDSVVCVDIQICGSGNLATQGCGQFVIKTGEWLYKTFWVEKDSEVRIEKMER